MFQISYSYTSLIFNTEVLFNCVRFPTKLWSICVLMHDFLFPMKLHLSATLIAMNCQYIFLQQFNSIIVKIAFLNLSRISERRLTFASIYNTTVTHMRYTCWFIISMRSWVNIFCNEYEFIFSLPSTMPICECLSRSSLYISATRPGVPAV